ncbi:MAG: hypothetical protein QM504_07605 [Pseudomonadota bacterium]
MQTWYLIIGIGTLLIVTITVNNIAEAIERKARERKLKILRLKRNVDNLSEFLDQLVNFDLPKEIQTLLQNEILSRLIKIQIIDRSFHGIADLIAESKISNEESPEEHEIQDVNNILESELQKKLTYMRQLTSYIKELPFLAKESLKSKINYHDIMIVYRFDKLSHFYNKQAQQALQNNDFKLARNHVEQITGSIALSGYSNQRLTEINEQAMLMLEEIKQQSMQFLIKQEALDAEEAAKQEKEEDDVERRGKNS